MDGADLVELCAEVHREEGTEGLSGSAHSSSASASSASPARTALRAHLARLCAECDSAASAAAVLDRVLRAALARGVLPETARTLLCTLGDWQDTAGAGAGTAATAAAAAAALWQAAAEALLRLVCDAPMDARVRRQCAETLAGELDSATGAGAAALARAAVDACVGAGTAARWAVHRGEPLAVVPKCVAIAEDEAAALARAGGAAADVQALQGARAGVEAALLEREWPAPGLVQLADLVKELLPGAGAGAMEGVVAKAIARIDACDDGVLDAYLAQLHEISVQCRPHRARIVGAVVAFADRRERVLGARGGTGGGSGSDGDGDAAARARLAKLRAAEQLVLEMVHYAASQDEIYERDVVAAVGRCVDPRRACPIALAVLLTVARLPRYENDVLHTLTRALLLRDRQQASQALARRVARAEQQQQQQQQQQQLSGASSAAASTGDHGAMMGVDGGGDDDGDEEDVKVVSTLQCVEQFTRQCFEAWREVAQELLQFGYSAISNAQRYGRDKEAVAQIGRAVVTQAFESRNKSLRLSVVVELCNNIATGRGTPRDLIATLGPLMKRLAATPELQRKCTPSVRRVVQCLPGMTACCVARFIRAMSDILEMDRALFDETMIMLRKSLLGGEHTAFGGIAGLCEVLRCSTAKQYIHSVDGDGDDDDDDDDDEDDDEDYDMPGSSQTMSRSTSQQHEAILHEVFGLFSRAGRLQGRVREFLYASLGALAREAPRLKEPVARLLMRQFEAVCDNKVADGEAPFKLSDLVQNSVVLEPLPTLLSSLCQVATMGTDPENTLIQKELMEFAKKVNACVSILDSPSEQSTETDTRQRLVMARNVLHALLDVVAMITSKKSGEGHINEEDATLLLQLYAKYQRLEETTTQTKKRGRKKKDAGEDKVKDVCSSGPEMGDMDGILEGEPTPFPDMPAPAEKAPKSKGNETNEAFMMSGCALVFLIGELFTPQRTQSPPAREMFENMAFRDFIVNCTLKHLAEETGITEAAGYTDDKEGNPFQDMSNELFARKVCEVLVPFFYVPLTERVAVPDSEHHVFEDEQLWGTLGTVNAFVNEALKEPRDSPKYMEAYVLLPCGVPSEGGSDSQVMFSTFTLLERIVQGCVRSKRPKHCVGALELLERMVDKLPRSNVETCARPLERLLKTDELLEDHGALKHVCRLYLALEGKIGKNEAALAMARDVRTVLGSNRGDGRYAGHTTYSAVDPKSCRAIVRELLRHFEEREGVLESLLAEQKGEDTSSHSAACFCQESCRKDVALMECFRHILAARIPPDTGALVFAFVKRFLGLIVAQLDLFRTMLAERNKKGKKGGKGAGRPSKKRQRTMSPCSSDNEGSVHSTCTEDDGCSSAATSGDAEHDTEHADTKAMTQALHDMMSECGKCITKVYDLINYTYESNMNAKRIPATVRAIENLRVAANKFNRSHGVELLSLLPDPKNRDVKLPDRR